MQLVESQAWSKLGCLRWGRKAGVQEQRWTWHEATSVLPRVKPRVGIRGQGCRSWVTSTVAAWRQCGGSGQPGSHRSRSQGQTLLFHTSARDSSKWMDSSGTSKNRGWMSALEADERDMTKALPTATQQAGPMEAGSSELKRLEPELCSISAYSHQQLRWCSLTFLWQTTDFLQLQRVKWGGRVGEEVPGSINAAPSPTYSKIWCNSCAHRHLSLTADSTALRAWMQLPSRWWIRPRCLWMFLAQFTCWEWIYKSFKYGKQSLPVSWADGRGFLKAFKVRPATYPQLSTSLCIYTFCISWGWERICPLGLWPLENPGLACASQEAVSSRAVHPGLEPLTPCLGVGEALPTEGRRRGKVLLSWFWFFWQGRRPRAPEQPEWETGWLNELQTCGKRVVNCFNGPHAYPFPMHRCIRLAVSLHSGLAPQWAPPLDSGLGHVTCFDQWGVSRPEASKSFRRTWPWSSSLAPCEGHAWAGLLLPGGYMCSWANSLPTRQGPGAKTDKSSAPGKESSTTAFLPPSASQRPHQEDTRITTWKLNEELISIQ